MQRNSKIIIGSLVVLCLFLGMGWAYQAGYVTSTGIFDSNDELKAKESSFWANYIHRFEFDGTEFVQNIALAIPIPEKLQYDKNYLLGTLTFKHNESKSKVIYVDTPPRVEIINEEGIFFYTNEILDNLTTRHKFHALPNVEYNIEYQINNINEFVDESGDVSFKLRNSEETKEYDVVTHFKSPLTDYDTEFKIAEYFKNVDDDSYYKKTITDKITLKLQDRLRGELAIISDLARLYDYGNMVRVYYWRTPNNNPMYKDFPLVGEGEVIIDGNKIQVGNEYITLAQSSVGKTIWYGGVEEQETRTFGRTELPGIDLRYFYEGYANQICQYTGYFTYVSYSRYNDRYTSQWYISSNNWGRLSDSYRYGTNSVNCKIDPFEDIAQKELYMGVMERPYMLDSKKEFVINETVTEIKVDLGEVIKTIDFTVDEFNVTRFTLLDEIELKELEPYNLFFIVDGKEAVIPIFYDPLRKHKELWEMFDRELDKFESTT